MKLNEIERLQPDDFSGGKSFLKDKVAGKAAVPLPGGSGFLYSTSPGKFGGTDVKMWDPKSPGAVSSQQKPNPFPKDTYAERLKRWKLDTGRLAPGQLIGRLNIHPAEDFPLPGAVMVNTITVDEDYRGRGIAKALYGIVLSIMKLPLIAGYSQTPAGARNWVSLSKIPGVEIKGYIQVPEDMFMDSNEATDEIIDTLMGKIGAEFIGKKSNTEYFSFDVSPNKGGTELVELVKTRFNQVYSDFTRAGPLADAGLYAIWTGK